MINERYRLYGMNQNDFYTNNGGARRPIPHIPQEEDDKIYYVKVDKEDSIPNYLKYKLSGTDGIIIDEIVSEDGSKTLVLKLNGGENLQYNEGKYISINQDERIISVSGLDENFLKIDDAQKIYATLEYVDGKHLECTAEHAELIYSATEYWNPAYNLLSSKSADWNKAEKGNLYKEGPYISIYQGTDDSYYISASGLTPYTMFDILSGKVEALSSYYKELDENYHTDYTTLSGVVWSIYSSCSGFPAKLSAEFDKLIASYSTFSSNLEKRVYEVEGKIPIVSGDGIKIVVTSSYDSEDNKTIYTVSSNLEGGIVYSAGEGIKFTKNDGYYDISTSGVLYQKDFNDYSSTTKEYIDSVDSYAKDISSFINNKYQTWDTVTSKLDTSTFNEFKINVENSAENLNKKIDGKLNTSDFESWSSNHTQEIYGKIDYLSGSIDGISGYIHNNEEIWKQGATYYAGNLINITDKTINVISGDEGVALSADISKLVTNINSNITNITNNSTSLSSEFISYSSVRTLTDEVLNTSASNLKSYIDKVSGNVDTLSEFIGKNSGDWENVDYSAGKGIKFTDKGDYYEISTSGVLYNDDFNSYSSKIAQDINSISSDVIDVSSFIRENSGDWENVDYSAGKGIEFIDKNGYYEITTSGVLYKTDFNTYSSKVAQDIDNVSSDIIDVSSFIGANSADWAKGDNYEISSYNTKVISAWKVEGENGYTFNISASESVTANTYYKAGDWVDSDKIKDPENPTIAISGWKPFSAIDPLYFEVYENGVGLNIDLQKLNIEPKSTIIVNGYANQQIQNPVITNHITATAPETKDGEWIFKFDKPMLVNININATFVPNSEKYMDYYDTVGFVSTDVTNPIKFTMFGYNEQSYNASTLASIPLGQEGYTEIPFRLLLGENDFIKEVKQPCITIQEL